MWGGDGSKQEYYKAGRGISEIRREDVDCVCDCGYVMLKPTSDFEDHNGGMMVKRSKVRILDKNGEEVKRLRGKDILRIGSCNACVNDWR